MTTNLSFNLIDGEFTPADAKRVLFTLIKDKINFHELELFSTHVRFGEDLTHSRNRISELNKALKKLEKAIKESEKNNINIKISGVIELIPVENLAHNEVFRK